MIIAILKKCRLQLLEPAINSSEFGKGCCVKYVPFILQRTRILHFCSEASNSRRKDESSKTQKHRSLPRLMNFPEITWPSALKSIKNWLLVNCIIRPYFDNEFVIKDFIYGAKHAIQVISSKLVEAEFSSLTNLLTSDAIEDIKPIVRKLNLSQRRQLEIRVEDIYLTFPYQIGIILDETNQNVQKRWVEITMVFHVLQGLSQMKERGEQIPWNLGTLPEFEDKVFVCNYRFIKEYTVGIHSDWTVNIVNHFKPVDVVNKN